MELKIKNEDIVQLRQNDLNRGRNKSNAPVYPKTIPEAILGLSSYLGKEGLKDVVEVDSMPAEGKAGVIYYLKGSNARYLVWSETNHTFYALSLEPNLITDPNDVERLEDVDNGFILEPNTHYLIEDWNLDDADSLTFRFNTSASNMFLGRFTAWEDNLNITWIVRYALHDAPMPPKIPNPVDIIAGHTYEFNLFYDVLFIADITAEEQGGE